MKKKTHEEYVKEIANLNINVIHKYVNARTPILHKCKICNYEWNISPDNVLRGYGCPNCAGVLKHTTGNFINELAKVNTDIEIIGTYINARTKINCKCLIDGCEWSAIPRTLLYGHGCPICSGNKKKTHEEYVQDVLHINSDIEVIGEYVNSDTAILHRCKVDGCEWLAKPNNILSGKGCPNCHFSIGEKLVSKYLEDHRICFIQQHTFEECKNVKLLPFDFYLPDYNVCIEYDGIQHFEPRDYFGGQNAFKERVKLDGIKTTFCLMNNIKLLRIRYDEDVNNVLNNFFNSIKLIKEVI